MLIRQEKRKVPLKTYTFLALTTVATMGFSNASLGYLNYPTQVPHDLLFLFTILKSVSLGHLQVLQADPGLDWRHSDPGQEARDAGLCCLRLYVPWADSLHLGR